MDPETSTFRRSRRTGTLVRSLALALLVALTHLASAQSDRSTHARLLLAADQVAACAGRGHAATARGTMVGEGSRINSSNRATNDYWDPFARIGASIGAVTSVDDGCWLDTSVVVDVYRHGCVYSASATLMAGHRPLASTTTTKARATETLRLNWRTRVPHPSPLAMGLPVYVDVRIEPVVSECGVRTDASWSRVPHPYGAPTAR